MTRRALVTGATGFIGTALTARLAAAGWEVHGVVRADGLPVPPALVVHEHDGTTAGLVRIAEEVRPDVAFHLASLFLAAHTAEQVEPLISANVLFGTQLLEALAAAGCRCLVNTSTVWQHYRGADYDPVCLYAATKQAFEDVIAYYVSAEGLSAVTLELFDTYGPDDPRPKLFSVLRKAAETGERLEMSEAMQELDYVYIDDLTSAFLGAAERLLAGGTARQERFEVRTGNRLTLRAIVETWQHVTGRSLAIGWGERAYRRREMMAPWLGGEELPGWRPKVGFEEGIRRMEGLS